MLLVNRVRNMVALLMLAVWPLASAHPVLQHFGLIHVIHDDHDADSTGSHEHDDDHAAADGHCLLTSTTVKVPVPQAAVTPLLICFLAIEWASELRDVQNPSGLAPPGKAPPELSQRWQFTYRTALPPRAPSIAW